MKKQLLIIILLLPILIAGCSSKQDSVTTLEPEGTTEVVVTPEPTPEPTPKPTLEPTPTPDPYTYEDELALTYGYTNNRSEASLHNMELAIEKVDGYKIMPGEVFSFNDTVGPTTEVNGYEKAEVFASYPDDEVFQPGGGVNIVASTLYCSALYGALDPVERHQHYYWLNADSFLKWGYDAYVCNDGVDDVYDMKISNPFDAPVLIKAYIDYDSQKLYVGLYGTNPEGLVGKPHHSLTSYYLPGFDWVCDRFTNDMARDIYDNNGFVRTDDLHEFDFGPDGDIYYHRHPLDYVW